jgi:hypothetical protein
MSALMSLGDTIASEARVRGEEMAFNETWPFVTTPDFEIKGANTRLDATMEFVMFAPIVTEENSARWEEYSVDHQNWLVKSTEQGLQTSAWFEHEFDNEMDSQVPHEDQAGDMDDMDGMDNMDDGDVDHSTMDHSLNLGSDRRFLRSMVSADATGDADMPEMDSSTPSVAVDDAPTGMNMTGMANSTSPMEMDGMTMSGMAVSTQTTEMNTTGMHSMDSSMGGTMDNSVNSSGGHAMDHSTSMPASTTDIPSKIYQSQFGTSQESRTMYLPVWQMSPPPKNPSLVNYDLNSDPVFEGMVGHIMLSGGQTGLSKFVDVSGFYEGVFTESEHWHLHDQFHGNGDEQREHAPHSHPHTVIAAPVRRTIDADAEVVGILAAVLPWDLFLSRLLPQGINGVYVVLENSCGQVVSYVINGQDAVYLGGGDLHQTRYDYLKETYIVSDVLGTPSSKLAADSNQCGKNVVAGYCCDVSCCNDS